MASVRRCPVGYRRDSPPRHSSDAPPPRRRGPLCFAPRMEPSASDAAGPAWSRDRLAGNPHEDREKAARVQQMFAAIARRYDLNNRLHSLGRDQAWRRVAVAAAGVGEGGEVLDVACGTGDLSEALAAGGASRVVGVDFSEPMLDQARAKQRRRGGSGCEYRFADAMDLPFGDGEFDAVTIAFGLRNIVEPRRALGEFRRVLRRGGRLVVLEFSEPRSRLLRSMNRLYTERIMPFTAAVIAGDRSGAYRYLPRSVRTFPDAAGVSAMIGEAGFGEISMNPLTFGVCTVHRGIA